MAEFEDGTRVRFVGVPGFHSKWKGRVGVVTGTYRATEEIFLEVQFEGEESAVSFYPEDFEAFKETYYIENSAEDASLVEMDLTDVEAALIQRVCEALNDDNYRDTPTLEIKKKEKP
jgi:type 1 glutamine amidotransferase